MVSLGGEPQVDVVLDDSWSTDRITPKGREKLRERVRAAAAARRGRRRASSSCSAACTAAPTAARPRRGSTTSSARRRAAPSVTASAASSRSSSSRRSERRHVGERELVVRGLLHLDVDHRRDPVAQRPPRLPCFSATSRLSQKVITWVTPVSWLESMSSPSKPSISRSHGAIVSPEMRASPTMSSFVPRVVVIPTYTPSPSLLSRRAQDHEAAARPQPRSRHSPMAARASGATL